MHSSNRIAACFSAVLLAALLCLPAGASQDGTLSPSVVLVLKLVSADRVQPVTGVVVSDDGLVLVPADFVANPAEFIVLDGGTDILGNGRPAQLHKQLPDVGLALLSVKGLKRPGITLSAATGDSDLHLEAFPPAQQIAAGADPLQLTLDPETPLPYVTGAVMDACGLLSGMSLTTGKQSLESGKQPLRMDTRSLAAALEALQLSVPRAACRVVHEQVDEKQPVAEIPIPERAEAVVEEPSADPVGEFVAELVEPQAEQAVPENPPVIEPELKSEPEPASEPVSTASVIPWWLQLAGLLVLAVLARGVFVTFRKHASRSSRGTVQPASDEPDTVRLAGRARGSAPVPRSGRDGADDLPDLDGLPEGRNGLVVLEGQLESGHSSRYFCAVDTEQFDIVIGRGEADIRIEHAGISRSHARLVCRGGIMTLSDLDSANGIYINRVPCLPGEIMYVDAADEICLGDVCLYLNLIKREAEPS